jgi:hypothetical protein
MTESPESCRCWEAPADPTGTCAIPWLSSDDHVAVTAQHGAGVEGRPDGAVWWQDRDGWDVGFQVEQDSGARRLVPLSAIRKITLRRRLSPEGVVDTLVHAFSAPTLSGAVSRVAVGNDEEHLEITIAVVPATAQDTEHDSLTTPGERNPV